MIAPGRSLLVRGGLVAGLMVVAAVVGCHDTPLTPTGRTVRVSAPAAEALSDPETVTLPVDNSADGSATLPLSTLYSTATLVEVTFNGTITRTNNATSATTTIGPAGISGTCGGLMQVTWDSGGSWWPSTGCTSQSQQQSTWTSNRFGVKGTATAIRNAGPTACGDPPPCFTYSGTQSVTVAPVQGDLAVARSPAVLTHADYVYFDASASNGMPSAYW